MTSLLRRAVAAAAVVPLVILVGSLAWAWIAGWRLNVVESESMAPLLHRNSLAVVVPVHGRTIAEGDVVAFRDPSRGDIQVMHRVTKAIDHDGARFFETRGDANAVADQWLVPAHQVNGKLVARFAHVGAVVRWLEPPRALALFVGVPFLALVAGEFRHRRRDRTARPCPACGRAFTAVHPRLVPVGWPERYAPATTANWYQNASSVSSRHSSKRSSVPIA